MKKISIKRVLCFICQKEVDEDMLIVVNHNQDDMICICRKHLVKFVKEEQENNEYKHRGLSERF